MIRKFNYTHRKKINREDVKIHLNRNSSGPASFDASLNLKRYKLPENALVFVEAYRQTEWMRFHFGSIGSITPPEDRFLTDFDYSEGLLFRVKVTSNASPTGKLLAVAEQVQLHDPDDTTEKRVPLLPVIPVEMTGQISRVDFSEGRTVLQVNASITDWNQLIRNNSFKSLVYTYAVREILTRILYVEKLYDTEGTDWTSQWLKFMTLLPGVSSPPAENETERFDDWIDDAVSAFGRQHGVMDWFNNFWSSEAES